MSQRPAIRKRAQQDLSGLPPWLVRAERLLVEAMRSIRLLGSVVPRNAAQERVRLIEQRRVAVGRGVEPVVAILAECEDRFAGCMAAVRRRSQSLPVKHRR